jgi:signal peptidase I
MSIIMIMLLGGVLVIVALMVVLPTVLLYYFVKRYSIITVESKKGLIMCGAYVVVTACISMLVALFPSIVVAVCINVSAGIGGVYVLLKKWNSATVRKVLKVYVLYTVSLFVISTFLIFLIRGIVEPFVVSGVSMNPTFTTKDYLVIKKFGNDYDREDIVVYQYAEDKFFIQRIIGMPGETVRIENGETYINDVVIGSSYTQGVTSWEEGTVTLRENEYFMMGDNRELSNDSRTIGPILKEKFIGEYVAKIDILSDGGWEFLKLFNIDKRRE